MPFPKNKPIYILLTISLIFAYFPLCVSSAAGEYAVFPCVNLSITQGAYEGFSHSKQNAVDFDYADKVYAPFTGTIKRIKDNYNAVWLESNAEVWWADGTYDYMTVLFMHDNDISNLEVGKVINQGDLFYNQGNKCPPEEAPDTGTHVHMAVFRGKDVYGKSFTGGGDVYAHNAFFIQSNTVKYKNGGYSWVNLGIHICFYDLGYESAHPHREYKICSCGNYSYTGTDKYEIGYEAAHPHREYFICSCELSNTYTGSYRYQTGYEAVHPHREYFICSCELSNTYTGTYKQLDSCVMCITPGKPILVNINGKYTTEESISFTWNLTENTTHYNLYIYKKNDSGGFVLYENIFYANSGITRCLPQGEYRILLQSTNSKAMTDDGSTWRFTNADYAYLSVENGKCESSTQIHIHGGNKYTFNFALGNINSNVTVMAVMYKNKKLVGIKMFSADEDILTSAFMETADTPDLAKVMLWDGTNSLKPMGDVEIIPNNEWISD